MVSLHDLITDALKTSPADYTEIRLEKRESTRIIYRGRRLESVDMSIDQGGIVRCLCAKGGWGMSTFNSLEDLPAHVEQAYQGAKAVVAEPIELAPIPAVEDYIGVTLERDFRGVPLAEKKALIEGYNAILLSYPLIVDTTAIYSDAFTRVYYGNSEGTYIEEERPSCGIRLVAIARDGDKVEQAHDGLALPRGFETVVGQEGLAHRIAQRATELISADTVAGGRYTVILNPRLAGVFIHEAFGHLSEADFIYANPQAQKMMVLGRQFGSKILNVADDGSIPGLRGSHRYDDEGTPTGRTDLIKEGVLVGRLHSRETAAKMGEEPTGNARATSYRYPPIVRMTNTFIEPGTTSFEEMISGIDLGIYACDTKGGQTAMENFSFSAAYAYMIRKGEIAEMVKDVVLSGNLFATLAHIDAVGNDFEWLKLGTCGKGQGGLPVSMGSPHIRIRDVLIGGR